MHAVVLPRTTEQRDDDPRTRGLPSLVVPEHAIDAQSLVALADLVVSAGGTMNREAVALGVPVYTTFAGRLGAVDSALVNEGRLRVLTSADELELEKRETQRARGSDGIRRCSSTSCSPRSRASTIVAIWLGSRPSDEGRGDMTRRKLGVLLAGAIAVSAVATAGSLRPTTDAASRRSQPSMLTG